MLDLDQYIRSHSEEPYKSARDYAEVLYALANDLRVAKYNFKLYGYDKRNKVPQDENEATHHKTAVLIVGLLDGAMKQVSSRMLTENDRSIANKYFEYSLKYDADTNANRAEAKISFVEKFMREFRKENPMEIISKFRYEKGVLYVGIHNPIKISQNTLQSALLSLLFENINKVWDSEDLIDEALIICKRNSDLNGESKFNTLKSVVQSINEKTNTTRLVIHEKRIVYINPSCIDPVDLALS